MSVTVVIVGRPNVGKSSLFNRLVGKKLALVSDMPNLTRDRRYGLANIDYCKFGIIDTAGIEADKSEALAKKILNQTEVALNEANLVLFLIDCKIGITAADTAIAKMLRKKKKPIVLVANKAETYNAEGGFYDGFTLGFGKPIAISAEHGHGISDLHNAILTTIKRHYIIDCEHIGASSATPKKALYTELKQRPLRIAVVGRPNVGKSTLINRFIGYDRLLTGPEAGITRDAIAVEWNWQGNSIELSDTAGVRREARITEKTEQLSVADSLRTIRFSEVVVVILDATSPFEKQDLHIANSALHEGRATLLAFNKWDMVKDHPKVFAELRQKITKKLSQVHGIRAVAISSRTGEGLDDLMCAILETNTLWNKRIPTHKLNYWLTTTQESSPPPAILGSRRRLKYITQVKSRPPSFTVFCSYADELPNSYTRYLINRLRNDVNLPGVPIRMHFRSPSNPYALTK